MNKVIVYAWLPFEETNSAVDFIELIKAKLLKVGTVGHVALEIIIENNAENSLLIDKYIKDTVIPHHEIDDGKAYRIYYSFYSGILNNTPHSFGKYNGDRVDAYKHRNTEWNQKYKEYIDPKSEMITPDFFKFLKTIPYVEMLTKIPFFEKFCQIIDFNNFIKPYIKTLGIHEIKHTTHLEGKKKERAILLDALSESNSKKEKLKIMDKLISIDEQSKIIGRSADQQFEFPLQSQVQMQGLNLEKMLLKMRDIEKSKDSTFDLYDLNCSESVLQILTQGEDKIGNIFSKRNFIFKITNPYLVTKLCTKYNNIIFPSTISSPSPKKKFKISHETIDETKDELIESDCPVDALSKFSIALHKASGKKPCLSSKTIKALDKLLKDDSEQFACLIYQGQNKEKLMPPKEAFEYTRGLAFQQANHGLKRKREN